MNQELGKDSAQDRPKGKASRGFAQFLLVALASLLVIFVMKKDFSIVCFLKLIAAKAYIRAEKRPFYILFLIAFHGLGLEMCRKKTNQKKDQSVFL